MHDEFFLLNEAPRKLGDLFSLFSQPDKVRGMVRQQKQAGACCALVFVHSHWPGEDLMEVANSTPLGRDEPMAPHYVAATAPSALVVEKILEESDRIVGARLMVKKERNP